MQIIRYKDGNGYLAKCPTNKHKRVHRKDQATHFNDGEAEKFIKNSVQRLFRDRLEIICANDSFGYKNAQIIIKAVYENWIKHGYIYVGIENRKRRGSIPRTLPELYRVKQ